MHTDQYIWRVWSDFLHRWGMQEWIASLLEAAGPVTYLGAQTVYIGQPILRAALPDDHMKALARLLEDPTQTRAFSAYLREVSSSEPA